MNPTYPMSFEQESVWLNDQFQEGASRYLESWTYRLRGARIVPGAVRAALDGIVVRHEALRTRLHLVDGVPRQTVLRPSPVDLTVCSVTPAELSGALAEAAGRPVALDRPPLLRATLLRVADDDAVLVVAIHHAVIDGWCWGLLDTEFSVLYRAALTGTEGELPEIPLQFGPYAEQQRAPSETCMEYWRKTLADAPEESSFPTDHPRPAVLSTRGDRVEFVLDAEIGTGVRQLARAARATPFAVLAAAVAALVAHASGQDDVVIGTPVSRRDDEDLTPMIACLSDVMPLRQRVSPQDSFADLVVRAKAEVWGAVAHRDAPYSHLIRDLNMERSPGRFPLFQVVFGLDDAPAPALDLPGVAAERMYVHAGTAKYDVFLHLIPEAGGFRGYAEFSTDLFDRSTVERLAQRLAVLLRAAATQPRRPLAELDLLPPSEHALLDAWAHGAAPASDAPLAHEAVAAQALRTPDALAVVHGERSLTYAQLDAAATAVAARLVDGGAAGQRVGVCLRRSPELAVAVLGVLKAGSCCLPLDPGYPADRIAHMAADSGIRTVLAQGDLSGLVPGVRTLTPAIDDLVPTASRAQPATVSPDDPAYLIYTSGSTGRPKGVALPHRALANLIAWQGARSEAGPGTRTLQFAPIGFDVAFQELFSTWATGGTLVLVDEEVRRDPAGLLDLLAADHVERLFLPFIALQQLAEYACATDRRLPGLREVVTAGEQLHVTPALREFFRDRARRAVLENQYGPSETHVVTAERLAGDPERWPGLPSVGRPIAGNGIRLLDAFLRPVPVGSVGELCVSGEALADGYLGRPELTAQSFPTVAGTRLYRTGDLARYLPDGRIQCLGRRDDQVKIRGHRVETGEVESALRELPRVADAAVVAQEQPIGGRRLLGYYLGTAEPGALRRALARQLPEYMVPTVLVALDAFPRTPSGKLDRAALPRPEQLDAPTDSYVAPATPTEERVAAVWAEVLGLARIGARDDFFALGGHSLLATRLVLRLRQELGAELPLSAIPANPTVFRLAALIDGATQTEGLDLSAEIALPADIVPAGEVVTAASDPAHVLLTGATGFLGAFTVHSLLERTDATVHCLVRGADREGAGERLRSVLEGYGLWDARCERRVSVVHGDLAQPLLGLSENNFDALARTVDAIYHVGAAVNLVSPYGQLKAATVNGTATILRLAARHRTVPVHHVSTVGVYTGTAAHLIGPEHPTGPPEALEHGYTRSKWVAEGLVEVARKRGLPVSLYRPTRIAGHSRTGACQRGDYLWLMLKGCVQAQAAPVGVDTSFDLVPVDHVADALVEISRRDAASGRTFHVASGRLLRLETALEWLRARGYELPGVEPRAWLERIGEDPGNAAFPLLGTLVAEFTGGGSEGGLVFDPGAADDALAGTGVVRPEVDEKLFDACADYFVREGWLPVP
ncbi:amino acid adenylation domain-containing protein [Streptomyces sp. DH7]|uniref:non-ribosomal peptide synthetase n=1 Tax=Streptomyces sp. DH7 TaxID=2857006 RepID=UPI001E632D36|nr:non-ribosomal peptide synthetase [Streptomyces sp. DH7]